MVTNNGCKSPFRIGSWEPFHSWPFLALEPGVIPVILTAYQSWDDPPSRGKSSITKPISTSPWCPQAPLDPNSTPRYTCRTPTRLPLRLFFFKWCHCDSHPQAPKNGLELSLLEKGLGFFFQMSRLLDIFPYNPTIHLFFEGVDLCTILRGKNLTKIWCLIWVLGLYTTLVFNGQGLLLEGSNSKIEDKQVLGPYMCIYIYTYMEITLVLNGDWALLFGGFHSPQNRGQDLTVVTQVYMTPTGKKVHQLSTFQLFTRVSGWKWS